METLKSKKGFTLIELLIVLAILGILAGMFVPVLFGNNKIQSDGCNPAIQSCQR